MSCDLFSQARDVERIKRKKLAAAARLEGTSRGAQVQSVQMRPAIDSTAQVVAPAEKSTTNQPVSPSGRAPEPASLSRDSGLHHVSKHHDKARASISTSLVLDNGSKTTVADVKKKMKRKPESDLGGIHAHPTKLPSQHGKDRPISQKYSEDSNALHQPKQNLQLPGAPVSSDQQS